MHNIGGRMVFGSLFGSGRTRITLPHVGQVDRPSAPGEFQAVAAKVASALPALLPTEQDNWWFLTEQYDRLIDAAGPAASAARRSPLRLHQIEHEGRRSEDSYVRAPNPGVAFLKDVKTEMDRHVSSNLTDLMLANVFVMYTSGFKDALNGIRRKYAQHFHDNCIAQGSVAMAGRWQAVLADLGVKPAPAPAPTSTGRAEGERLFKLGMEAAVAFRSNEAIDLYTRSIAAWPNPSPYMNRANLLMKRVRCREALLDLLEAKRIDDREGREFGATLSREIQWASVLASNYENGTREKLVADLKVTGRDRVAKRIICVSFDIHQAQWDWNSFDRTLLEYHLFNDLDDIRKFDDLALYPEARELLDLYDGEFIDMKVARSPSGDAYADAQAKMHNFLCSYDMPDMLQLRRYMLYRIHDRLLSMDFGPMHNALDSDCEGIIAEAERFVSARVGGRR